MSSFSSYFIDQNFGPVFSILFIYLFILVVLEFELRASLLLDRCSVSLFKC
jgi:hypothetical protein